MGPWVSPGTYTVTLTAGGASSTQTVEVRGDPGKPDLTAAQYRAREGFLLELLDVQREAFQAMDRPGAPESLRGVCRGASRLAGDFNGSGSVQGSLYPPTPSQVRRLEELRTRLDEAGR